MVQPQMPAPQAQQWDPQFLAYMNQQMAQLAQATGGQWRPAPEPTPPMEWPEALHAIAARAPWHSEEDHNRVRDALVRFVATIQQIEQDLAAIRARIPVLAAPVTPAQQQVLDGAAQAPPPAPAPAFPFPGFIPQAPQAAVAAPWPQFGPTGQPVPPAMSAGIPPQPYATFPPGFQPPGAPVGG